MSAEYAIKTLMTIDDNETDQMLYKRVINRSGLVENIIAFQLATDALAYLKSEECEKIDVILLDINMPIMNGFEFLERATNDIDPKLSSLIVIMLTTSLNQADVARAKEFGVVKAYFNKPLNIEHLESLAGLLKH